MLVFQKVDSVSLSLSLPLSQPWPYLHAARNYAVSRPLSPLSHTHRRAYWHALALSRVPVCVSWTGHKYITANLFILFSLYFRKLDRLSLDLLVCVCLLFSWRPPRAKSGGVEGAIPGGWGTEVWLMMRGQMPSFFLFFY